MLEREDHFSIFAYNKLTYHFFYEYLLIYIFTAYKVSIGLLAKATCRAWILTRQIYHGALINRRTTIARVNIKWFRMFRQLIEANTKICHPSYSWHKK